MSLEKNIKSAKLESLFVFFFTLACERIFIKTYNIESRCVIEPENILFGGMSVNFQPGTFTGQGSEGVKSSLACKVQTGVISVAQQIVEQQIWTPHVANDYRDPKQRGKLRQNVETVQIISTLQASYRCSINNCRQQRYRQGSAIALH